MSIENQLTKEVLEQLFKEFSSPDAVDVPEDNCWGDVILTEGKKVQPSSWLFCIQPKLALINSKLVIRRPNGAYIYSTGDKGLFEMLPKLAIEVPSNLNLKEDALAKFLSSKKEHKKAKADFESARTRMFKTERDMDLALGVYTDLCDI